jgi:hypothetical protein
MTVSTADEKRAVDAAAKTETTLVSVLLALN